MDSSTDISEDESVTIGGIILGLSMVILAGILNGSWNASFSPTHGLAVGQKAVPTTTEPSFSPTHGLAVGQKAVPTTTEPVVEPKEGEENLEEGEEKVYDGDPPQTNKVDLSYHHAWILFQVYAALINIPICIWWAGGPNQVQAIVREASTIALTLVIVFSLLWGIGSVGFGLACQIAGVGLGTNLCMGVIMVLGTFLPLCLDGAIATPGGGVVVGGLAVCSLGLVGSIQSLQIRDADEKSGSATMKMDETTSTSPEKYTIRRRTLHNTTISLSFRKVPTPSAPQGSSGDCISGEHDEHSNVEATELESPSPSPSPTSSNDDEVEGKMEINTKSSSSNANVYSTWQKVLVCVVAGIFATQLQFAFVFGDEIIDLAETIVSPNGSTTPESGTSAVIWLFAISLGAPVSILYGIYKNPPEIPHSVLFRSPLRRHFWVIVTTALPWVAHIHLYGLSNLFLPEDLAASIAWPCLMMTTVVTGMIWSLILGEWKHASSKARTKLYQGLACVSVGVLVIMSSVAL